MKNTPLDMVAPPFSPLTASVAGKQTITSSYPCRWGYQTLDFIFSGWGALTAAQILGCVSEIRVKANDLILQRMSGLECDESNKYYGAPAFALTSGVGILSLPQRQLGVRGGVQGIDFTAKKFYTGSAADISQETWLNTGSANSSKQGINSLVLEMDVIGTPAGTPLVQGVAQVVDPYPGGAGLCRVITKTPFNTSISTNNTLAKNVGLAFGDIIHSNLKALHLFPQGGGTLDAFTLYYNNTPIIQRSAIYNTFMQNLDAIRKPNVGTLTTIEYSPSGFNDQVLSISDPTTDLRLVFSDTAAETVNVIQDCQGYMFGLPG